MGFRMLGLLLGEAAPVSFPPFSPLSLQAHLIKGCFCKRISCFLMSSGGLNENGPYRCVGNGIVGVGVALPEEVCHMGWPANPDLELSGTPPVSSLSARCHVPAMMMTD